MTAPIPSLRPDAGSRSARASVVVPTYNRSASLLRALRSLAAQIFVPDEVVVVDDHSVDDTARVCEIAMRDGLPFEFRYVRQRRNLGPAAARNLGVAHARNGVILFTDDDCEPEPQWAGELVKTLELPAMPAGVGGPIVSAEPGQIGLFFDHHRLLDPKFVGPVARPAYLVTANACYRREWLLRVGGFDEDLRRAGGEDPGLSFKISAAGGRLAFAPGAVVRHHYPTRLRSIVRTFWNYGYGGCHVARAHPNPE